MKPKRVPAGGGLMVAAGSHRQAGTCSFLFVPERLGKLRVYHPAQLTETVEAF